MNKLNQATLLPLKHMDIQDTYWTHYMNLIRHVVVPYQWEALNDRIPGAEPSCAIQNFRIAAGDIQGEYHGMMFQDSDPAKWLEAAAYLLEIGANPELERLADETIELIARAQHEDGYLNTYYTVKEPGKRWTNLAECHELYCAGHLIEAAVAYFHATGKRKILDVVCRLADYIDSIFGTGDGQIRGYDGHQEIELALVKLYQATGEKRYLLLSKYFLDERGQDPYFFEAEWEKRGRTGYWNNNLLNRQYCQAHKPVRSQNSAEGHAVRLVYMCAGMVDVAVETQDEGLLEACRELWKNMVSKRMYITGGIGSKAQGEAFSLDYDLPNDTVYAETCASIGLIFFAQRMLRVEANSEYADIMERALYNTVLGGMSLDGRHFFYVNPLEVWPEACEKNENFTHVKPTRQGWFACACCPPNVARLLASLGQYIYTQKDSTLFTHLYIGGQGQVEMNGRKIRVVQESKLPWAGHVSLTVHTEENNEFTLALRIPSWSGKPEITINGASFKMEDHLLNGYVYIHRIWKNDDVIQLILPMSVLRFRANPLVRANIGKVALQRGPLVYCLEEADNGANLQQIVLPSDVELKVESDHELLGGVQVIVAEAERIDQQAWGTGLYQDGTVIYNNPQQIKFIPYYAWANREVGEMSVWVRERA
ncbi:MAG TPA: beta-L-arabinofuranosidase domain-containing protein [Bacilli bacterium]